MCCLQVAEALEGSESLTLSEDKARVRRTVALTSAEQAMMQIDQRSLYASPFPFDTSLDAITAFFSEQAPVNCVRMRRHAESKDFRGSIFVEFADQETAEKVLCWPLCRTIAASLMSALVLPLCGMLSCFRSQPAPIAGMPASAAG